MKLRIAYIPQVPMQPFYKRVATVEEAKLVAETLWTFSAFELANNIKLDYSDALDLEIFEDGEWVSWYDDKGNDFQDWLHENV